MAKWRMVFWCTMVLFTTAARAADGERGALETYYNNIKAAFPLNFFVDAFEPMVPDRSRLHETIDQVLMKLDAKKDEIIASDSSFDDKKRRLYEAVQHYLNLCVKECMVSIRFFALAENEEYRNIYLGKTFKHFAELTGSELRNRAAYLGMGICPERASIFENDRAQLMSDVDSFLTSRNELIVDQDNLVAAIAFIESAYAKLYQTWYFHPTSSPQCG
jgi:hypothetical protein